MAAFWISSGTVKSYDGDGNRSEAVAPVTEEETKVGAVGDAGGGPHTPTRTPMKKAPRKRASSGAFKSG